MKIKRLFLVLAALSLILSSVPGPVKAQREVRVIAYPTRAYEDSSGGWRDKGPLKDFVVEFQVEAQSRAWMVTSSEGGANEVLRNSEIRTNEVSGDRRIIKVVAGFKARKLNGYRGSVQDFARTLKLQYLTPFRPRG
jgi:hypothetical protein